MTMKSGSYYEGTINGDNSGKSIKLTLDKKSKIKLTGDSYVTSLDDADTDYSLSLIHISTSDISSPSLNASGASSITEPSIEMCIRDR